MESAARQVTSHFDEEEMTAIAKAILSRLDEPRRKSEAPVKPIIVECFGSSKSGKDTNLNELERWFNRRGFRVYIHRESDETREVCAMHRVDSYAFEMRHFVYNLSNLLDGWTDSNFHLIIHNRGIFDNLFYLSWNLKRGAVTKEQFEIFKRYVLGGPWVQVIDAVLVVTCDVDEALRREYGTSTNVIYGSRMNPEVLREQYACVGEVTEVIREELPNLPLFEIDTTDPRVSIGETRDEIVTLLLRSEEMKMGLSEEEVLLESTTLMKRRAHEHPPQIRIRGTISHAVLRRGGWDMDSSSVEVDTYLTPKGTPPLERDECFHIRDTGAGRFLVYKRRFPGLSPGLRIAVPIPDGDSDRFLSEFEVIATLTKKRERFRKDGFVLAVDNVEDLGEFVEIKAPTIEAANSLMNIVEELGFSSQDVLPDSYLRLYLKKHRPGKT